MVNARLVAYVVLPLCFSLLGLITSVGLFGLREWARKVAIFLSVAPVTICGLLLLLESGDLPLRGPSHDLWVASPFAPRRNISAGHRLKVRDSNGWRPGYSRVCMDVRDSYPSERMVAYPFHAQERALSISLGLAVLASHSATSSYVL